MSRHVYNRNQGQALLGAWQQIVGGNPWQQIVGWQQSGVPSNMQHGVYGGHPRHLVGAHHGHHGGMPYGLALMGADPELGPPPYGPPPFATMAPPQQQYRWPVTPRNAMIDYPGASRADRVVLPMSSGVNILPNTSAQITSRPQNVAFRPERLIIGGTPADWIVNDIKVGNRSQFSQSGDVPGEMFAATTIDSFVSFETVQTAMDFVVLVTFVGASESGSPFVCGVLGTAAI